MPVYPGAQRIIANALTEPQLPWEDGFQKQSTILKRVFCSVAPRYPHSALLDSSYDSPLLFASGLMTTEIADLTKSSQ
jgi:hypothetical protein